MGVTIEQTQSKPPLEWMNGAFNRIDKNILYLLQQGVPEWNKDCLYPVGAIIKLGNELYLSKEDHSGSDPLKLQKWEKLIKDLVINDATLANSGIVKLNNSISSTSTTEAATANSVKTAYDRGSKGIQDAYKAKEIAESKQDQLEFLGDGKVLKENAFGLGNGIVLTDKDDLNNFTNMGFYRFSGSCPLNTPTNYPYGFLNIYSWMNEEGVWQICGESKNNGALYYRFKNNRKSSFSPWYQFYTEQNKNNLGLGYGQTWQNVTTNRSLGVTYTNTTGKPIMLSVYTNSTGGMGLLKTYINGSVVSIIGGDWENWGGVGSSIIIIPINSTYKITLNETNASGVTLDKWWELR